MGCWGSAPVSLYSSSLHLRLFFPPDSSRALVGQDFGSPNCLLKACLDPICPLQGSWRVSYFLPPDNPATPTLTSLDSFFLEQPLTVWHSSFILSMQTYPSLDVGLALNSTRNAWLQHCTAPSSLKSQSKGPWRESFPDVKNLVIHYSLFVCFSSSQGIFENRSIGLTKLGL